MVKILGKLFFFSAISLSFSAILAADQQDQLGRIRLLLSSNYSESRMQGVKLLEEQIQAGNNIDKASVRAILTALLSDQYVFVRIEAVKALGQTKDYDAVPLLQSLSNDQDKRIRIAAVEALGSVRQGAHI